MDIHVREIDSACYGMIDNKISKLIIRGFKFDCERGEYIRNGTLIHSVGPLNIPPVITYWVCKINNDKLYTKFGRDLFDSKEELIKDLLKHEPR